MRIRPAAADDQDALWTMLEPVIRAGEVFALPRDMDRTAALAYWFAPTHTVFIAEEGEDDKDSNMGEETYPATILGSYYIQPNQAGPGSHVANCGYLTAPWSTGRGVASAMCAHSLNYARHAGYHAMQFNFVISTNLPAIHLWTKHGFRTLARLPQAFQHPTEGYVDALIMWQSLSNPLGPAKNAPFSKTHSSLSNL